MRQPSVAEGLVHGACATPLAALAAAEEIGSRVMLKSTAGGGGIGMSLCADAVSLTNLFAAVSRLGSANFGNDTVFLDRAVSKVRRIEYPQAPPP